MDGVRDNEGFIIDFITAQYCDPLTNYYKMVPLTSFMAPKVDSAIGRSQAPGQSPIPIKEMGDKKCADGAHTFLKPLLRRQPAGAITKIDWFFDLIVLIELCRNSSSSWRGGATLRSALWEAKPVAGVTDVDITAVSILEFFQINIDEQWYSRYPEKAAISDFSLLIVPTSSFTTLH